MHTCKQLQQFRYFKPLNLLNTLKQSSYACKCNHSVQQLQEHGAKA